MNTLKYTVEPVSNRTTASIQMPGLRTRVPSHHMRELVRGQFLIQNKDITLMDCIGEGVFKIVLLN